MAVAIGSWREWRSVIGLLVAAMPIGCHGASGRSGSTTDAGPATRAQIGYPAGRWQLAGSDELEKSIVWISHIVVMHRDSHPERSPLRGQGWTPDSLPERSREEAFRIAREARGIAAREPGGFGDVARKYSDDGVTRELQGSLGGVRVSHLPWQILDALSVLEPGDVSELVETDMGFHIILRRRAPPAEEVTAARIVVAYDGAGSSKDGKRTRSQALERARSLVEMARSGEEFGGLAEEQSDSADRVRRGAMGTWSTREPGTEQPVMAEVLATMKVGEVSNPVDSSSGFQILKRLPLAPAVSFAMRAIKIPFGVPGKTDGSLELAEAIARKVLERPGEFERLAAEYCCNEGERWRDGHGDPLVTSALAGLEIGSFTRTPIKGAKGYFVAQRLPPEMFREAEPPRDGMPAPVDVQMRSVFEVNSAASIVAGLEELPALIGVLKLPKDEEAYLLAGFSRLQEELPKADSPDSRVAAYNKEMIRLHGELSAAGYGRALSAVERWVSSQMLMRRPGTPAPAPPAE